MANDRVAASERQQKNSRPYLYGLLYFLSISSGTGPLQHVHLQHEHGRFNVNALASFSSNLSSLRLFIPQGEVIKSMNLMAACNAAFLVTL